MQIEVKALDEEEVGAAGTGGMCTWTLLPGSS